MAVTRVGGSPACNGAQLPSSQALGSDATAVSLWGGTEPP